MDLINALKGFVRAPFRGRVEQSLRAEEEKSLAVASSVSTYIPGVREPFLQAWQRGLSGSGKDDPVIMAFSAVYACVTIISEDVAKLPLNVMKTGDKGVPEVSMQHPIQLLFENPNSYQTMLEFMQQHMAAKLMTGNSYIYMVLDQRGVCREMHLLPVGRVLPLIDNETKAIFYQVNYGTGGSYLFPEDQMGPNNVIPARFIINDRINCLWHPLLGVSPITAAAYSAMTGGRIMMQSEEFFANYCRPGGILTAPGTIAKETATRLKEEWQNRFSQRGKLGETAVLGDGLTWEPLAINAVDAQLIEQLRWTIEDVARVFRVPLYMLAELGKTTFRNSEQMARAYFQGCLQYHLESTERRFDKDLGLSRGVYCAFDLEALFRMESDVRYDTYQKGIQAGVLSINEARAKEGLPPVKGGEIPRVQMQYVPVDTPVPNPLAPVAAKPPAAPAPEPNAAPAPAGSKKDGDDLIDAEADDFLANLIRNTSSNAGVSAIREGVPQ